MDSGIRPARPEKGCRQCGIASLRLVVGLGLAGLGLVGLGLELGLGFTREFVGRKNKGLQMIATCYRSWYMT